MPINTLTGANLHWFNLNIGIANQPITQLLPQQFDVVDANGNLICTATKQMNGARLAAPGLFTVPPPANLPGGAIALTVGDQVHWNVQNGALVIQNVARGAGIAAGPALPPPVHQFVPAGISTNDLRQIGFADVAVWAVVGGILEFQSIAAPVHQDWRDWRPSLYAHCEGDNVRYIGKSTRRLELRMDDYRRGLGGATNNNVHRAIRAAIALNSPVTTLAFWPQHCLQWGSFRINVPAGLEDTLIECFQPDWNA